MQVWAIKAEVSLQKFFCISVKVQHWTASLIFVFLRVKWCCCLISYTGRKKRGRRLSENILSFCNFKQFSKQIIRMVDYNKKDLLKSSSGATPQHRKRCRSITPAEVDREQRETGICPWPQQQQTISCALMQQQQQQCSYSKNNNSTSRENMKLKRERAKKKQ